MRWEEEISSHLCEIEDPEDPRAEASETRPSQAQTGASGSFMITLAPLGTDQSLIHP